MSKTRYIACAALFVLLISIPNEAFAFGIHTFNQCVVSLGGFCPVETLGFSLLAILIALFFRYLSSSTTTHEPQVPASITNSEMQACTSELVKIWRRIVAKSRKEAKLSETLEFFVLKSIAFLEKSHPRLLDISGEKLFDLFFSAARNSGTHTKTRIDRSVKELESEYQRRAATSK
jgi:hypothetical protein